MSSALALKALEMAVSRIGMKENPLGSNWGHPVQDWLARVDCHQPAAWCMAFAWCCVDDAAAALGVPNPLPRTAGVLRGWQMASPAIKVTSDPQPGDIFIMDLGGGLGHCGIVKDVPDATALTTIDGNTNNNGSREGVDVEQKSRHQGHPIIGYFRF